MRRSDRRRTAGFTLIEVLLGFAILLVVFAGLLPIFTRSVLNNVEGRESTQVSNLGRSQLEDRLQLAFNSWDLTIDAGTERQAVGYWDDGLADHLGDEEWSDDAGQAPTALWVRTTTVRQYGINGVRDNDLDGILDEIVGLQDADRDGHFDNPLAAGTPPINIHLKDVEVQLQNQANLRPGEPIELTLYAYKAF